MSALSVFYCLIITTFSLVLELSHLLSDETERVMYTKDLVYGLYMYGCSIIFFVYFYYVLMNKRSTPFDQKISRFNTFIRSGSMRSLPASYAESVTTNRPRVTHSKPSAGSLFLRFGCVGTLFSQFVPLIQGRCSVRRDRQRLLLV